MNKFLDEILQQPDALRDTLAFYESEEGKNLLQRAINLCQGVEIAGIPVSYTHLTLPTTPYV